jgi:hypothetical protein
MGSTSLAITYENPALADALKRPGPTVVLDATADVAALTAVARRPVHVVARRVVDGSSVRRVLVANARGAKIHLAPRNRTNWDRFGSLLADALSHIDLTTVKNVLVVSHKACTESLRSALASKVPHPRLRQLLDMHRQYGGQVVLGHFGHLKGRNEYDGLSWKALDALISVGDPWPDLGAIAGENRLLHLSLEEAEDRMRQLVASELGQAHGRLRAPRQVKPTVAIHVGSIIPAGWNTTNTVVIQSDEGRPPNLRAMTTTELRILVGLAGSGRKLAQAVDVDETTIRRYLKGRAIPPDFAARVRKRFRIAPDTHSAYDASISTTPLVTP